MITRELLRDTISSTLADGGMNFDDAQEVSGVIADKLGIDGYVPIDPRVRQILTDQFLQHSDGAGGNGQCDRVRHHLKDTLKMLTDEQLQELCIGHGIEVDAIIEQHASSSASSS